MQQGRGWVRIPGGAMHVWGGGALYVSSLLRPQYLLYRVVCVSRPAAIHNITRAILIHWYNGLWAIIVGPHAKRHWPTQQHIISCAHVVTRKSFARVRCTIGQNPNSLSDSPLCACLLHCHWFVCCMPSWEGLLTVVRYIKGLQYNGILYNQIQCMIE